METMRLTLTLNGGLLVGGQYPALFTDSATAREVSGVPIIPASAVKGALRIEFERFVGGLKKDPPYICKPENPNNACGKKECIVCALFGAPGNPGKLRFSDACIENEWRKLFTDQHRNGEPTGHGYANRHGVAVNRIRKSAEKKMLFSLETVEPIYDKSIARMQFVSCIEAEPSLSELEFELLQASVSCLRAIGAEKSRGLGRVEAAIQRMENSENSVKVNHEIVTDARVVLVPQEYLRVSGIKKKANFMESEEFIPGSAVRGAVARSFAISRGGWDNAEVREFLFKKPVLFSNFYPSSFDTKAHPKPVPLSAMTCKSYPGFEIMEASEKKTSHGSLDILISSALVKLFREMNIFLRLDLRCKLCSAVLIRKSMYYRLPGNNGLTSMSPAQHVTTKTALNRMRFTSAENQLYSYAAMDTKPAFRENPDPETIRFIGTISGIGKPLLDHLSETGVLYIGGARSRGFGKMKIEILRQVSDTPSAPENRMAAFTKAMVETLRTVNHPKSDRLFFSITCTSDLMPPAFVSDCFDFFQKILQDRLCLSEKDLCLEAAIADTDRVGGFKDAIGLQKDLRNVIKRGSAFVYSCMKNGRDEILKHLPQLINDGLGDLREEGFGRVSFCDEFHLKQRIQI